MTRKILQFSSMTTASAAAFRNLRKEGRRCYQLLTKNSDGCIGFQIDNRWTVTPFPKVRKTRRAASSRRFQSPWRLINFVFFFLRWLNASRPSLVLLESRAKCWPDVRGRGRGRTIHRFAMTKHWGQKRGKEYRTTRGGELLKFPIDIAAAGRKNLAAASSTARGPAWPTGPWAGNCQPSCVWWEFHSLRSALESGHRQRRFQPWQPDHL